MRSHTSITSVAYLEAYEPTLRVTRYPTATVILTCASSVLKTQIDKSERTLICGIRLLSQIGCLFPHAKYLGLKPENKYL